MSRFSNDIEEIWVLCESRAGVGNGTIEFVLGSVECDGKIYEHGTHFVPSRFNFGGSFENSNLYYEVWLSPEEGTERPVIGGIQRDKFVIHTKPKDIEAYLKTLRDRIGKKITAKIKWIDPNAETPVRIDSKVKDAEEFAAKMEKAKIRAEKTASKANDATSIPTAIPPTKPMRPVQTTKDGLLPGLSQDYLQPEPKDRSDFESEGIRPDGTRIRRRRT